MALVDNPTGADVADFLGIDDPTWIMSVGGMVAGVAREMAASYCRNVGFDDPDSVPASLRWVVLMRAIRLAQNYSQLISESKDSATNVFGAAGQGWTIHEITALEDFRVNSA